MIAAKNTKRTTGAMPATTFVNLSLSGRSDFIFTLLSRPCKVVTHATDSFSGLARYSLDFRFRVHRIRGLYSGHCFMR